MVRLRKTRLTEKIPSDIYIVIMSYTQVANMNVARMMPSMMPTMEMMMPSGEGKPCV